MHFTQENGIGIKLNVECNFPFLQGDHGDHGQGRVGVNFKRERRLSWRVIAILVLSPSFAAGAPSLRPALHYF